MMRRTIWKKALAAFLAVSMMALTSCGEQERGSASSEASGDQLERIQQAGEIVIATEGTWSPWTFHDENDELVGYDVEVGKLIAEKLGVEPVFVEGEWDGLFAGLDAERYDGHQRRRGH